MNNVIKKTLCVVILATNFGVASAGTTVFSDSTFDPTVWNFSFLDIGGSIGTNQFCLPSHSCAEFRQDTSSTEPRDIGRLPIVDGLVILGQSSGNANVHGLLENTSATWDPATDGLITQIDWSVDVRMISRTSRVEANGLNDNGVVDQNFLNGWGIQSLIVQDGIVYSKRIEFACDRNDHDACSEWHTVSRSFDNFAAFSAPGIPNAPGLDLSPTGSPLTFGLVAGESGNGSAVRVNFAEGLLDNWQVTVHSVPEPDLTASLVIVALLGMKFRMRRSCDKSGKSGNETTANARIANALAGR